MEGNLDRARSVAWQDARQWVFKPREIVPVVVIGIVTYVATKLWAPTGDTADALFALAAIGVAAVLIPSAVWLVSFVTAPHRLLRDEVRSLHDAVVALLPVVSDKETVLRQLGQCLSEGADALDYVAATDKESGARRNAWDWENDTEKALKKLLGDHEAALFRSAESELSKRQPETLTTDETLWTWQHLDVHVRWLRNRIEQIRDDG